MEQERGGQEEAGNKLKDRWKEEEAEKNKKNELMTTTKERMTRLIIIHNTIAQN